MMRIIVIGNGMVGYKFCEKWLAQAPQGTYELHVFGEEPRPAYDRVHLSDYFSGKTEQDLYLAPAEWYANHGITLHLGELVTQIDREAKTLSTHKGLVFTYDKLILATGSAPFVPLITGTDKQGVFVYRTIEDLEQITQYGMKLAAKGIATPAAVLGGGLLGLEAAKAVRDLGLETHVVEFAPRLMPRQLDERGGDLLREAIQGIGVQVHLSKNTSLIAGQERISHLEFVDGSALPAEMLVISAGILPRDELARLCGLEVGPRGGVVVDEYMRSSDPNVYAIGEVALYQGMVYGLVAPGYEMAEVAVGNILGKTTSMSPVVDLSTSLKLIGIDVASFGDVFGTQAPHRAIVFEDKLKGIYKRLNVSEDGKKLLGGILVGDASDYNQLLQIYKNAITLPPEPEALIVKLAGGESAFGSVLDLPDAAVICSCESVSKGQICAAVSEAGCETLKAITKCTKAISGCGGCKPMVDDLLKGTLKAMGKTVKETVCEHFPHSRQELFDIVKVKNYTRFETVIAEHGTGYGCEVCKPVLASIFASIHAETAVAQSGIQDTNDRFLANIQRNGTYSVVPRIPGGEITPEKLIAIGEVAQKYELYTKITGGQRIDLFGARLDDLPFIWEELIAAGFESGHAYGKALRTVKSCVGSTWCRFGMLDSVSFAIEVEERYKGIRAPHKIKGGVSGCIRECAEARGKDFGIIATEEGWNLYVCGNGGANPKHAVLLAEKIDSPTCLRYLDRFLMFYIKTAGPLVRTAPWLEKMEGGINYLREVIVNDSLGIGAELDVDMANLINNYQCEWKEAVENPAIRARFKHFVNSEDTDENIEFVSLREQKMPRAW
ncbi:nitrite reductase large subunit NirB [Haliscomenobacter hydrossis]|uniref:Nitrite reductase (NAD(P)H), large subunit n=1 Tax=Haliscomenobacter hydrossis (strain ATCC 27775 / DSM 1100 / LMG 10767 / O) TaxID=760192 RepID=F4L723_HALH1|nr:nitrite reductase large subunit NirB [Haliscomenobacter hydrossis]AEE52099.1 nitrite reductase (NAD(P)H), large subunit [Haliscomenobacter hydrossis DSM 1100]